MLIRFIKQITIFLILSKSFLKHLLLKRPNLMLRCDKVVDKNLIDSSLPFRKNFLRHKARNMLYLKIILRQAVSRWQEKASTLLRVKSMSTELQKE